jgi:hypothetical protein
MVGGYYHAGLRLSASPEPLSTRQSLAGRAKAREQNFRKSNMEP